ncbi:pyridoxal phosphate-dependent aminotransferase [Agrobacterium tumefaciens]|jgi:histidinol-phosphate aminotransferase|uniref:pyridoxal phosphate-dependent aminotransferase n=1 Tax=Agrobacterium TaxID=357 RepID=UPI000DCFB344|nr:MULTISPECIES: pyridoxal phosphate-dependent aminotransferase [Agrobacterium]NSY05758.1 pyridoxal phosphate-dependent aminotransferase [Agrobacterium tumefaciens]NSY42598.1 pyridoxal phosphate-dependent aminotransferase [Agrobacterium tumefaciens]NSZ05604.1 pyridoxal phosphate-dependent aminotransferase [Agrobacterium tumefaciens]NSZ83426.1 pyridoxal phosphate-dependent aminotransferase [Agrobacterium tumefaciens]NTC85283.1 pyridoxal phosphate-dependent aminotransferase [Agrobacterium tumefa
MSAFSRLTPLAVSLPSTVPFVGPEAIERGRGLKVEARIGANESGFGPAPSVLMAMRDAAAETWMYSDPENFELKEALAIHHGVSRGNIAIGGGVDGLLGEIARLIVEPGTPVVTSLGGYPTFNYHVNGFGGKLVTTPYVDDHENLDGLLDLVIRENAPLVYFANPDNPMGSWWEASEVVAFARALPETCLLILDEAYCETAPASAVPSIDALIGQPNILRMRTFSKAYGLAGARVGYAIGTLGNVEAFDKIRNHFGMARVSVAGALAALKDQAYLHDVVGKIAVARDRISAIARNNGLSPLPSATNFVTIDCQRDGTYARAIVDGLMEHGVFIRMPGVAPLNRCIRVSVGPDDKLDLFEQALPKVIKALG